MPAPVLTMAPTPAAAPPLGPARRRSTLGRGGLAVVAGLLLAGAFAPLGWAPLAVVAVAGLTVACRGTRPRVGALLGAVFGAAFFLPLLHWSSTYVGAPPWLLLAASQAVFLVALGAGLGPVSRLPGAPLWMAGLWVAVELARSRLPFGGFPWGRLAFSQAGTPYVGLASLGGAPLVTFGVALTGTLLAAAIVARRRGRVAVLVAAAAAVPLAGHLVPLPTAGEPVGGPARVTVAVVQGNVPRLGLQPFAQAREVLRLHVAQTLRLAEQVAAGRVDRPDLVVWPENASDIDPFRDADARALIGAAAAAVGVPVLVGAVLDDGPTSVRNTGIVWDPTSGPGAVYDKRHPVPFAEYIPFRPIARAVSDKVDLVRRDFRAGTRPGVLRVGPALLGDVICFEVAYDGLVRDTVTGGGRLIVVQTNNATFGRSAETEQQLAMSRVRAVEHGRAVLVGATSGVSAVIGPDGEVRSRTGIFTADTLVESVPLRTTRTLATRLGSAPEYLLGLLGLGACAAAVRRARPSGRRPRRGGVVA